MIKLHWADGRKLVLPSDWTPEQAMRLLASLGGLMEPVRYIVGYIEISDQMLRDMLEQREAERQWAERMDSDPEYAAEWLREQAERDDEDY